MSDIRYDGRVVIVTGAGGGLGRSHALEFARRGAQVVVKEIEEAGGIAVANYDSVATKEGGEAIVKTALDNFGKVDVLINNAGILRDRSFAKMTEDEMTLVLQVHLRGAFYVSQPAFISMKQNGYGRFVHTASAAGVFGNFGQANYGAAKMGLVGLSNVLAQEGVKSNIKSNVIAPIAMTRMTEGIMGEMGLNLDPAYVTSMVAYLASEACDLTHEIFSVGAGRFARVFVGLCQGYTSLDEAGVSVEGIRDNIEQIRNTDGFSIPGSAAEEMIEAMKSLKS